MTEAAPMHQQGSDQQQLEEKGQKVKGADGGKMQDVIYNWFQVKAAGIKNGINCSGQNVLKKDGADALQLMGNTGRFPSTAGIFQGQAGEKNEKGNMKKGEIKNQFTVIQNFLAVVHQNGQNGNELGAVNPGNARVLLTWCLFRKRLGCKNRCSQKINS